MNGERLLVMSCSERKNRFDAPRPASEVYDGPGFRVVRKYCEAANSREGVRLFGRATKARAAPGLLVMIISAEYGPIPWAHPIEYYDRQLVGCVVHPAWCLKLRNFCNIWKPASAFVFGGQSYKFAVPVTSWRPPNCAVELSSGGQGFQLQQLKHWLEER